MRRGEGGNYFDHVRRRRRATTEPRRVFGAGSTPREHRHLQAVPDIEDAPERCDECDNYMPECECIPYNDPDQRLGGNDA